MSGWLRLSGWRSEGAVCCDAMPPLAKGDKHSPLCGIPASPIIDGRRKRDAGILSGSRPLARPSGRVKRVRTFLASLTLPPLLVWAIYTDGVVMPREVDFDILPGSGHNGRSQERRRLGRWQITP